MSTVELMKAETAREVSNSQEFAECVKALARFQTLVPTLKVEGSSSKALAAETLIQIKNTEKRLEEMRKSAKAPFLEMGKTIDNVFRPLVNACVNMHGELSRKLLVYQEEERAAFEKSQREAMKKEIEARAAGEPLPPPIEAPASVVESDSGKVFTRKRLKFEIIDEVKLIRSALDKRNQIPLGVVMVNESKLRECVNGKLYSVKNWARYGVRVYEVEEVATRSG